MECSETSKVFIRRKEWVWIGTQIGSGSFVPLGWFKSLTWGQFFWFPLAIHLAFSGSESIFGLTQGSGLCACASFSQDGFQHKGFWGVNKTYYYLVSPPFSDPWGTFLHMCNLEGLLELKNEKYMVSLSLIKAGFSSSLLLRLLRVPWTARRSNQSIRKEISPNIHWKDWCWSSSTLVNWCEELTP